MVFFIFKCNFFCVPIWSHIWKNKFLAQFRILDVLIFQKLSIWPSNSKNLLINTLYNMGSVQYQHIVECQNNNRAEGCDKLLSFCDICGLVLLNFCYILVHWRFWTSIIRFFVFVYFYCLGGLMVGFGVPHSNQNNT